MENDVYTSLMNAVFCAVPDQYFMQAQGSLILSSVAMATAHLVIAGVLILLTTKSVLVRRSILVYALMGLTVSSGLDRLFQVFDVPMWAHMAVNFTATTMAVVSAFVFWRQRHAMLRVIYQFRYTIGLLKNLDLIDEANRNKTKW
jgi:hypothetical protein